MEAVVGSFSCGSRITTLFLENGDNEIPLSPTVLKAAVGRDIGGAWIVIQYPYIYHGLGWGKLRMCFCSVQEHSKRSSEKLTGPWVRDR